MVESPAGFWIRLLARIIDYVILLVVLLILGLILGEASRYVGNVINILYYIILPISWAGCTIGKRLLGIRIAKVDGSQLSIGSMILREFVGGLIYAFSLGICAIISAFMVGLRQDKRAIHDLIAGTYVTHEPAPALPSAKEA